MIYVRDYILQLPPQNIASIYLHAAKINGHYNDNKLCPYYS